MATTPPMLPAWTRSLSIASALGGLTALVAPWNGACAQGLTLEPWVLHRVALGPEGQGKLSTDGSVREIHYASTKQDYWVSRTSVSASYMKKVFIEADFTPPPQILEPGKPFEVTLNSEQTSTDPNLPGLEVFHDVVFHKAVILASGEAGNLDPVPIFPTSSFGHRIDARTLSKRSTGKVTTPILEGKYVLIVRFRFSKSPCYVDYEYRHSPFPPGSRWIGFQEQAGVKNLVRFVFTLGDKPTATSGKVTRIVNEKEDAGEWTWTPSDKSVFITFKNFNETYEGTWSPEGVKGTSIRQGRTTSAWRIARVEDLTAATFGLPIGNRITAPFDQLRRYPVAGDGRSADRRKNHTVVDSENEPAGAGFVIVKHGAVDISSRPTGNRDPAPLEFRAGVYGKVVDPPQPNTFAMIRVRLQDGSVLEFLHTSSQLVSPGSDVEPTTVLGHTGKVHADAIHLHVQAKDRLGRLYRPDEAVTLGKLQP